MLDVYGKHILVMGLGVNQGGIGVARYLSMHGADVRVTDLQPASKLQRALDELRDLPIRYRLGEHIEEDFRWAEIVVRNPGVPRESRWLEIARNSGARIEMEMTLFMRAAESPIIGITGTKGKTTTSTIGAHLLGAKWPNTKLAGNMGRSALGELDHLDAQSPVVLELSSFQLEAMAEQCLGPNVAVITNILPDHLDRYRSFEAYAEVKRSIAEHLGECDWLVISRDDPVTNATPIPTRASVATAGFSPGGGDHEVWIEGSRFRARWDGTILDLGPIAAFRLPGAAALRNLLLAQAVALSIGVDAKTISEAIPDIAPVANRLETVAEASGVLYVNDTAATIPQAAIAGLNAFSNRPLVVLAGGSDKGLDLSDFARELARREATVLLFAGTASSKLADELRAHGVEPAGIFDSMDEAVHAAALLAVPGGVVLMSPGCASFGMFQNEFDRGEQFRQAVRRITHGEGQES